MGGLPSVPLGALAALNWTSTWWGPWSGDRVWGTGIGAGGGGFWFRSSPLPACLCPAALATCWVGKDGCGEGGAQEAAGLRGEVSAEAPPTLLLPCFPETSFILLPPLPHSGMLLLVSRAQGGWNLGWWQGPHSDSLLAWAVVGTPTPLPCL